MIVLVASALFWVTQHRYSVLLLWVAALGGGVLNTVLKLVFDRPRPQVFEWRAHYAGLSSFPSGHATLSMVAYITLAYLIIRLAPTLWMRLLALSVAGVVVLLIGLSRLYLGVHYPSDVLAGYAVGFVWANFCALGVEGMRRFRDHKPR
jgi:undecaprenyl-diphosphatase